MRDVLTGFAARTGHPLDGMGMGLGIALAAALLVFLSGKTAAGLLILPLVVLAHSFLLSFTVSSALLAAGGFTLWDALWRAGAAFLPVCLLEWPALLLLAAQSSAGSQALLLRGVAPPVRWETHTRAALCCLSLCLAAAVRAWPAPWIVSTLLL
jgi:hypothetical protein